MKEKAVAEIVKTTGEVANEAINKGFTLLEQLAAKIGVTVDYLWPFMVREHVVQCIVYIMLFVVSVPITALMVKLVDTKVFWEGYKGHKSRTCQYSFLIVGIIFAVSAIVGFIEMWSGLPGLLNPEYHALRDLIEMVK